MSVAVRERRDERGGFLCHIQPASSYPFMARELECSKLVSKTRLGAAKKDMRGTPRPLTRSDGYLYTHK